MSDPEPLPHPYAAAADSARERMRRRESAVEHLTIGAILDDDPFVEIITADGSAGGRCSRSMRIGPLSLLATTSALAAIRDAITADIGPAAQPDEPLYVCSCCRKEMPADDVALRLYLAEQRLHIADDQPDDSAQTCRRVGVGSAHVWLDNDVDAVCLCGDHRLGDMRERQR